MKPPIVAGVLLVALICAVAGTSMDFVVVPVNEAGAEFSSSLWKRCIGGGGVASACSVDVLAHCAGDVDYAHRIRTARGFSFLACFALLGAFGVSVARVMMIESVREARHQQRLLVGLVTSAGAFSAVQFSVVFSIYTSSFCGKPSFRDARGSPGPCPWLFVSSLVIGGIGAALELLLPSDIDLVGTTDKFFTRSGRASNNLVLSMSVNNIVAGEGEGIEEEVTFNVSAATAAASGRLHDGRTQFSFSGALARDHEQLVGDRSGGDNNGNNLREEHLLLNSRTNGGFRRSSVAPLPPPSAVAVGNENDDADDDGDANNRGSMMPTAAAFSQAGLPPESTVEVSSRWTLL